MQMLRTFVAVDIAPSVASRVARLIAELQSSRASVKWVGDKNLHLTLQFLGDVESLQIPAVCDAVQSAAAVVDPFELVCGGVGAFPDLRRPRTLWVGVQNGAEEMGELQRHIEKALAPLGFRPEARQYHPHLTIGRVKQGPASELAAALQEHESFQAGSTLISEAIVYSSELSREGPTYTALARAALGA